MRLAAALLAGLIVAFAVLTYLSYNAAFASTDTVTVSAPRAGLVMENGGFETVYLSRTSRNQKAKR